MSASKIDLSKCSDLAGLAELAAEFARLVPAYEPLLIGALARDVLLKYAQKIPIHRATEDIDFAFLVEDWAAYGLLLETLLASKDFLVDPRKQHRLIFRGARKIDLIPFGGVERADRTIAWPPDGGTIMQALGYREALHFAIAVALPANQRVKVVSLPTLSILKLVAWNDRHLAEPRKDADDLGQILKHYLSTQPEDRIYKDADRLLEKPEFDVDRAGAWLLGSDARSVLDAGPAPDGSVAFVSAILSRETDPNGTLALVGEMTGIQPAPALLLLESFFEGFTGSFEDIQRNALRAEV